MPKRHPRARTSSSPLQEAETADGEGWDCEQVISSNAALPEHIVMLLEFAWTCVTKTVVRQALLGRQRVSVGLFAEERLSVCPSLSLSLSLCLFSSTCAALFQAPTKDLLFELKTLQSIFPGVGAVGPTSQDDKRKEKLMEEKKGTQRQFHALCFFYRAMICARGLCSFVLLKKMPRRSQETCQVMATVQSEDVHTNV